MRDSPDSFNRMRLKTGSATTGRSYGPSRRDVATRRPRTRTNRLTTTFSPVLAERSPRSCSIVLPSCLSPLTCSWSSRTTSPYHFFSWPSTILGRMFSGLSAASSSKTRISRSLSSWGISSSVMYCLRRRGDVQREVLGELDEVLVLGDEVGVALDLDQHADLAGGVHVGLNRALGVLAPGELAELVAHLDPEQLRGLVDVALGLDEGVLAVHHAGAGLLAKGLDVGSADRGAHGACSVDEGVD